MADLPRHIALVYDRVNKWGGAERVLLALHELFPDAPLYTAVYNSTTAGWAQVFPEVIPSFLQKFPGAKNHHELYPWLTPMAFESLDFSNFDAVISVTSADAKGIITKPSTFHLCYCLTPTRYLWSHSESYRKELGVVGKLADPVFNYLKKWDQIAAARPDAYISISKTVQDRVNKYYARQSEIVYPPIDVEFYARPAPKPALENFFLYVGRLVAYKQVKILVDVFNDLQLPLAIIGEGALESRLKQIAKANIYFLGNLIDSELAGYYQHAQALLFYHEEDFGIVPVEAMAAGTPIIGLGRGGLTETVIHGRTGHLVQNVDELKNTIINFNKLSFDASSIHNQAQNFSQELFKTEFAKVFSREWTQYKHTLMS